MDLDDSVGGLFKVLQYILQHEEVPIAQIEQLLNDATAPRKNREDESDDNISSQIVPENMISMMRGLDSIALAPKIKEVLSGMVTSIRIPETVFRGVRSPINTLMIYGPPGTGKTFVVSAFVKSYNDMLKKKNPTVSLTYLSVSGSSMESKYFGDTEKNIRSIFSIAMKRAPSVIFIDEIDSVLGNRNSENSSKGIAEFLIRMSELEIFNKRAKSDQRVIFIGATNFVEKIDTALIRRMEKMVLLDVPDMEEAYEFIRITLRESLRDEEFAAFSDEDFIAFAKKSVEKNFSISDIKNALRIGVNKTLDEAAMSSGPVINPRMTTVEDVESGFGRQHATNSIISLEKYRMLNFEN